MKFCCRWAFPALGMTVLSVSEVMLRFRSARSSQGLETPSTTEPHIGFFFLCTLPLSVAVYHKFVCFCIFSEEVNSEQRSKYMPVDLEKGE